MTSFFRRFSLSSSSAEPDDPSTSRRSSSGSYTGRIYGARDYKLGVKPATENLRRKSIVEDYSNDTNDTGTVVKRRYSVPYGPRHFQLAAEPARNETRRKSIIEDFSSSINDVGADQQRRYSVPYGSRHYQYATADETSRKASVSN